MWYRLAMSLKSIRELAEDLRVQISERALPLGTKMVFGRAVKVGTGGQAKRFARIKLQKSAFAKRQQQRHMKRRAKVMKKHAKYAQQSKNAAAFGGVKQWHQTDSRVWRDAEKILVEVERKTGQKIL